jgi:hypothetical protein
MAEGINSLTCVAQHLPKLSADSAEPHRFMEHHEALQGLRNSALFWAARAHVAGVVASGTSSLLPSSSLLLTLLTASPCLARVACGTRSEGLIGALSEAVQQLAPFTGEVFIGAPSVERRSFKIGTEVLWPSFRFGSTLWRVALESLPDFEQKKRGTVFVVKSQTGRLIGPHSQYQSDSEAVFLPFTRFRVINWYHGSLISLGQSNIRQSAYAIKSSSEHFKSNMEAMVNGSGALIIELEQF